MSLRLKASLFIVFLILSATAASAFIFSSLRYAELKEIELQKRRGVCDIVARAIGESHLSGDPLLLLSALRDLQRRGDIVFARAQLGGLWHDIGKVAPHPSTVFLEIARAPGIDERVELSFSRAEAEKRLAAGRRSLQEISTRVATTIALLGLLMTFPLSWTVTRRIVLIEKALAMIGAGTLTERLPSLGYDEIGRLGADVNAMADKLSELDQLKKTFVTSVTHELRSPLGVIEGYVSQLLMRSTGLSAEDRAALDRILRNTRRLGHFVTNLLDFAKIERGKLDFAPRRADPSELIENTVRFFAPKAQESRMTLVSEIQPGLPMIRFDPDLVAHVLTNLISNALKFTRPGGRITVSLKSAGGNLELAVADTGVGIKSEDLARIFTPFQRVANPLKATGVGLGLAISREIAAMHKGELGVTSEAGKGSRFFLTIPLDAQ